MGVFIDGMWHPDHEVEPDGAGWYRVKIMRPRVGVFVDVPIDTDPGDPSPIGDKGGATTPPSPAVPIDTDPGQPSDGKNSHKEAATVPAAGAAVAQKVTGK